MAWVAVATVGGSLIGGLIQSDSSRSAANTAADASRNAADTQLKMFNQTQQNLQPYMQAGLTPLSQLGQQFGTANAPGNQPFGLQQFQQSPAYQFNLQQGQQAIDKAASARGNYYAPQTLQDISKFSQGMASNEFQNAFSNYNANQNNVFARLNQLSSGGQNAAAGLGGISAGVGQSIGGAQQNAGAYQAAGILGQGTALSNVVGQGTNAALQAYMLQQQQQGLYGTGPANQWMQTSNAPAAGLTAYD
jgi:hypothetical protein